MTIFVGSKGTAIPFLFMIVVIIDRNSIEANKTLPFCRGTKRSFLNMPPTSKVVLFGYLTTVTRRALACVTDIIPRRKNTQNLLKMSLFLMHLYKLWVFWHTLFCRSFDWVWIATNQVCPQDLQVWYCCFEIQNYP